LLAGKACQQPQHLAYTTVNSNEPHLYQTGQ
jgi:hypothetical protein